MTGVGDQFPDFALADQNGKVRRLAEFEGREFIIYFYPKDDTSGCTAQACGFRDQLQSFNEVLVIGVSPDGAKSHLKFATKYALPFVLLADPDRELIEKLALWVDKQLYGRKYKGVERTTYLVSADGVIQQVWRKVKPQDHEQEVLKYLAENNHG